MPRSRVGLDDVMKKGVAYYSVQGKDFGGTGRGRRISEARGMAAWLILELGVCTLGELGGNRPGYCNLNRGSEASADTSKK